MAKPNQQRPGGMPRPDIIRNYEVTPAEAESGAIRLIDFLLGKLSERKRTGVKSLLKYDQVMVNGALTSQFDTPLTAGDRVSVNLSRPFVTLNNHRLKIVYEDNDIVVVNKGYGLLSVGNDKIKQGTAYSIVRDYLKAQNPMNKIFIVHRLDQHTSGLMVFAKTMQAKETLQHNWNNFVRRRQYVCLVEGALEREEGVVKTYLAENSKYQVYVTDNPEEGKLALTRYKTLRRGRNYTLAEVELETGRKNQIRVHMAHMGHPIAGDRKYGAKTSPINRLALHARTLVFIHPTTRRLLSFETPVPAPFMRPN